MTEITTIHHVSLIVADTERALRFYRDLLGLVVIPERDDVVEKSARNLPWAKVLRVEGLNVYDVLKYESLVILRGALDKLEERL
mgnify:CR=1 FL=1